jgi:hypothetical protein
MEAASRPPLELLPDLPVEEPLDVAAVPREPLPASSPDGAAPAAGSRDPEQTGLNFVDPEMFLAAGQQPSAVPVAAAASAPVKDDEVHELMLEDPVVDDLLTTPPPPAPPAPAAAAAPARAAPPPTPPVTPTAAAGKPAAVREEAAARMSARVPIARTASLAATAGKIAPASAGKERSVPKAAPTPAAAPAVANAKPAASPSASTEPQPAPKLEAPSLASWANARAAAAPSRVSAAPAVPPMVPAPAPTSARTPVPKAATPVAAPTAAPTPAAGAAPPAAAAAPAPAAMPAAPPMDLDFIARNQVVERYLSGRLPLKGATDFERFCHDHPELLDHIGLPERVNAGVRLLEASGKPEPWQEAARPAWQKPQVMLTLAATMAILVLALAIVIAGSLGKSHRIAELQKQAAERPLDPATSRRDIRLLPSRSGASNTPAIIIGGSASGAQLADFKIDESRSPYHTFRVTIDRIDQGRVGVISNLAKDSNGHLRIALNSSALGPGNYQLTLEGLDWRGEPQPDSWVTIGIQH